MKELCQHCHGKGEVSTACRGCKGKGIVLDEKRTRFHGVPVYKICGRCNGNRFSRLPTTLARRHVQKLVPDLTDYQWYSLVFGLLTYLTNLYFKIKEDRRKAARGE
ncbi:phage holin [Escherichia coli]|uniref:phage holin n=1 Tax=Escherichia coli TaxID=562 RepID=UPI003D80ADDF